MVTFLRFPGVSRITNFRQWLEVYPAPEKTAWTRRSWIAFGLVSMAVLVFCGYFILYLTQEQLAYHTNAEDLGIMDQAIWNTVHGQVLHQTICNVISDTNCTNPTGIMRFAIHFEPILLPISLLYLIFPDPRTLLIFQTIVVALGAYPAFLLAYKRLQHKLLAVALALLYLLYPAQQQATVYDFHAVTLTATLLLFVIYFMYIRRTLCMFVFAFLAMACKEEISLVIVMLGLWSIILQHRWRSGLLLVLAGLAWFFLAVDVVMPYFSPTGHPLLLARFGALGNGPLQIIFNIVRHPLAFLHQYILEKEHRAYLHILFIPALFLPLLAPWVMVIALPSLLLNLISSDRQMYTGLFQYNAEIVPILLFATIEAVVIIMQIVRRLLLAHQQIEIAMRGEICINGEATSSTYSISLLTRKIEFALLVVILGLTLASSLHYDFRFHGNLPFSTNFTWPTVSSHALLAQQFVEMIPPTASVSAQSRLVPHVSQRRYIYLFPYGSNSAEYIFLDTTSDIYPYFGTGAYERGVRKVLASGHYRVLAQEDGFILLKRGLPSPSGTALNIFFTLHTRTK